MLSTREIKEDLQFNAELGELLDTMKNIAVFRFRMLQRKKEKISTFLEVLGIFFAMAVFSGSGHPFIRPRSKKSSIVIITSDEGFMGGLNLQVIDAALAQPGAGDAALIVVGDSGARYLKEVGKEFTPFKGAEIETIGKLAVSLTEYLVKSAMSGQFGSVQVFYPASLSFMMQRVKSVTLLPLTLPAPRGFGETIIESPLGGIIEYLAEKFMVQKFIEILEDSKLSEFAARAIHLEKSSQELAEQQKLLRFRYLRAYHEIINRSAREMFSARMLRRKRLQAAR